MRAWLCRLGSVRALALGVVLLAAAGGCGSEEPAAPVRPRVLVLGIDGMDPARLHELMRAGKLPNFARLARDGAFLPLGTSIPPQSPVAWSDFSTGMDAGGHGIFDFLRHDHRTLAIAESGAEPKKPSRLLGIPIGGGGMVNLRHGRAFWEHLEERGIPATVCRVPANFPPVGRQARTFSGLGTPDMRGTQGWFTYYTDQPPTDADSFSGGAVVEVKVRDHVVRTELTGPPNLFCEDETPVRVPLTVFLDPERTVARIDVGEERVLLVPGEWSAWVRVAFPMAPLYAPLYAETGIVRFFLKSLSPALRLYMSSVNVDPASPAFPISTPPDAIREQSRALGLFHTKGMPVDTKALQWEVLDEGEFLLQALGVLEEEERLLEHELAGWRRRGGFLFFYFATVDQVNHMAWSAGDARHPAHRSEDSPALRGAMPLLYREMDRILGRVRDRLDADTTLIVMSDHGFAPFYRQAHVNTWLAREGFLALFDPGEIEGARLQEDVDWLRTRAYAIGFNGIYLNLEGRETMGRVSARNRESVLAEIERKLLAWRDPVNGKPVVRRVYRPGAVYSGPLVDRAPDLILGYARGYRGSNRTALGEFGRVEIEDNLDRWSGDHMMAAEEVPGILLMNRPVKSPHPRLVDLPVTILELYGIPRPPEMIGASLIRE
ncbi:MAG: alkaline phosphatase family protein [Planctomycetes bacterium]|nr:alkaline phosphatase family protein [Planctomycetota bacterium]